MIPLPAQPPAARKFHFPTLSKDRFGALPPAAGRLVKLAELRVECASAGISHIDVKDERAIFYRNGSRDMVSVSTLKAKNADRKISELTKAVRALRQTNA